MDGTNEMDATNAPPTKRFKSTNHIDFARDCHTNLTANAFSMEREFDRVNFDDLEKLKQFQVLDEIGSEPDESDDASEDSEEVPDDEVERMLEEDLPDGFKGPRKPKEKPYATRNKLVLEEKGANHFEVLPVDWLVVTHDSGIPVYLHRTSRVCTLAKPYFLGTGSVRKHEIPVSAIPCLAYRRALADEEKRREIHERIKEQLQNGTLFTDKTPTSCPYQNDRVNIDGKESDEKMQCNDDLLNQLNENRNNSHETVAQSISNGDDGLVYPDLKKMKLIDNEKNQPLKSCKESIHLANSSMENGAATNPLNVAGNSKIQSERCEAGPSTQSSSGNVVSDKTNKDIEIPESMKPVVLPGGLMVPAARIETMQDHAKKQHLTHDQVTKYCKNLFKFKNVTVVHFKHWIDRRRYEKAKKAMQPPTVPKGIKLIKIPVPPSNTETDSAGKGVLGRPKRAQQEFVVNMNGRSYVSVFHEYARRVLEKQPVYEFRHLENAATPYEATVLIDGMRYAVGVGRSKRLAKLAAARESILILIPEMKDQISKDDQTTRIDSGESDLEFFDMIGIEDPRIIWFCNSSIEPSPHAILRICLLRNFGFTDKNVQCEVKKLKDEKIEFKMSVGKHSATVVCKNKKMGKQRAAQAILQALHPHVKSWGSLLRLYGSRSVKSSRMRKLEEQEITLLQDRATINQPNYAILDKLKLEMHRLHERDTSMVPIGTFVVDEELPNLSGSRLNNLEI